MAYLNLGSGESSECLQTLEWPIEMVAFKKHSLNHCLRKRWTSHEHESERVKITLEDIENKLAGAEKRREEFKKWVLKRPRGKSTGNHTPPAAQLQELQDKQGRAQERRQRRVDEHISAVEARRLAVQQRIQARKQEQLNNLNQTLLDAAVRRASVLREASNRAHAATVPRAPVDASAMEHELEAKAELAAEKLRTAKSTRAAILNEVVQRAAQHSSHAKHVSQQHRETLADTQATLKRELQARLEAAYTRRLLHLRQVSAAHRDRAPDAFLRASATHVQHLRTSIALRKLQLCWRSFQTNSRTTAALASAFVNTAVPGVFESSLASNQPTSGATNAGGDASLEAEVEPQVVCLTGVGGGNGMPWQRDFDAFSAAMQAPTTLRSAKALLSRFQHRVEAMDLKDSAACKPLLQRLFPRAARSHVPLERYPPRVFLCAYMLQTHPQVILSGSSSCENDLQAAAAVLLKAFERVLVSAITVPDQAGRTTGKASGKSKRQLLQEFDSKWVKFLKVFVAWKFEDAHAIESDLIKMAVEMQESIMLACGGDPSSPTVQDSPQLKAIVAQAAHDHKLMRQRILRLGGQPALARLNAAIDAVCPVPTSPPVPTPAATNRSTRSVPTLTNIPEYSQSPERVSIAQRTPHEAFSSQSFNTTPEASTSSGSPISPWMIPANDPPAPVTNSNRSPSQQSPDEAMSTDNVLGRVAEYSSENEGIIYQLLLNPGWRLPMAAVEERWEAVLNATGTQVPMPRLDTGTSTAASLQHHIRCIAEDAVVNAAIDQSQATPEDATPAQIAAATDATLSQILNLISELGTEVAGTLPSRSNWVTTVRTTFSHDEMSRQLSEAASLEEKVRVVAGLLELSAKIMIEVGSIARAEKAREAASRVPELLQEALASDSNSTTQVFEVMACAVRMLMAQLHVLKIDSANAQLMLLASSLPLSQALEYASSRFADCYNLPFGVGPIANAVLQETIPITAELALSSPSAMHVARKVSDLRSASIASRGEVPSVLRSGLRSSAPAATSSPSESLANISPSLSGTECSTWQARYRCALTALLLQPVELTGNPSLPEVLRPFGAVLDEVKDSFQQELVLAVTLETASSICTAAGKPLNMEALTRLHRRLSVLTGTSTEALTTAFSEEIAWDCGVDEASVLSSLTSALLPSSPALSAMMYELLYNIQAVLIFGPSPQCMFSSDGFTPSSTPAPWSNVLLKTPYQLCLHNALGSMLHGLGRVAAVTEAVNGDHLSNLFSE